MPVQEVLALVLVAEGNPHGRPRIIAIDGRGASGKSTLAARLQALAPGSSVVHTEVPAWHEPLFDRGHLLADSVLRPLHQGRSLVYRLPQWKRRGRCGSIDVPAGSEIVFLEGTGASQREHESLVDATVWVQADFEKAERRGVARDVVEGVNGNAAQATGFWHEWMREERSLLDRQRPWRRACVMVNGTPRTQPETGHLEVTVGPKGGLTVVLRAIIHSRPARHLRTAA
jgi:hypothetical protein